MLQYGAEWNVTMATLYALLGVEADASQEAIERAFAEQWARYAPERLADLDPELQQTAAARRAELERAYYILRDPERRRQYDASLASGDGKVGSRTPQRRLTPRERNFAIAGAIVAIVLLAVVWALTGPNTTGDVQAMSELNRPAPVFSAPALGGGTVRLEDYRGKVLLLNFWGTWCEPCKRELPALQAAHEQLGGQDFAVIGVNLTNSELAQGRSEAQIQAFVEQFGVTFPIALDMEGTITNDYRVFPLPTSFFIDPQGTIRYARIGELTLAEVQATVMRMRNDGPTHPPR